MKIFILEDDEQRIALFMATLWGRHELTICSQLEGKTGAFLNFEPPYDLILLDHDLGGLAYVPSESEEEETGFHFVKFLVGAWGDGACSVTPIVIHSYNPAGAINMEALLKNSGFLSVRRIPFGSTLLAILEGLKDG